MNQPSHGLQMLAPILLLIGTFLALKTSKQMKLNHLVVRRAMAAGIEHEYRHPELGNLYRNSIDPEHRDRFQKSYGTGETPIPEAQYEHIGLKPNLPQMAKFYAAVLLVFTIGAIAIIVYAK
jgi:hypothetical protein